MEVKFQTRFINKHNGSMILPSGPRTLVKMSRLTENHAELNASLMALLHIFQTIIRSLEN